MTDTKNVAAQAYFLKIEEAVVPASSPVSGGGEVAAVYYRVPATATLKLLKGKEEIMSYPAIVPQLGEIKKFPVDVISMRRVDAGIFILQFGSIEKLFMEK